MELSLQHLLLTTKGKNYSYIITDELKFVLIYFVFYSLRVRIVTSERSGMGKSLYIQRLAENLKMKLQLKECGNVHVTIPLHGPVVTPDTVLELFKDHVDRSTCCIYHIDIAPNVCIYKEQVSNLV